MMQDAKISYAQNREDIILEALVGGAARGFYVDVGANDPHKDSVTKRFYLKGWQGINLEPNRLLWERLEFDRPRDINIQVGAGAENGTLAFREYSEGDGLSTFSNLMKEENERTYTYSHKDYEVEVRTLASIFKEYNVKQIDFMKIDVEGYEWEVIQGNQWNIYRPRILCIEANHTTRLQKWHTFLDHIDYEFVFFDGLNEYYRDKTQGPWQKFSYPEAVLALPIVTHGQYQEQSTLKTEISGLNRELDLLRIHIRHLWKDAEARQRRIDSLQAEIQQMRQVRFALKTFIKSLNNAIKQRIEGMNQPAVVTHSFKTEADITVSDQDTARQILKKITLFDYRNSYTRTIVPSLKNKLSYRILNAIYGGVRRLGRLTVKGMKKIKGTL